MALYQGELVVGVLPRSLRGLHVTFSTFTSAATVDSLSSNVLPAGLQALFISGSVRLGVMPASLEWLSVEGDDWAHLRPNELMCWRLDVGDGSLPAGLRWLSLPSSCKSLINHLVPPDCEVQWRAR